MREYEKREKSGGWLRGSKTPELYGRTLYVPELAVRNEIFEGVVDGWLPRSSFEIPNLPKSKKSLTLNR